MTVICDPRTAVAQWADLLRACLSKRTPTVDFAELARLLALRYPVPGRWLAGAVVAAGRPGVSAVGVKGVGIGAESREAGLQTAGAAGGGPPPWEPLVPAYLDVLCRSGQVGIKDVLDGLLVRSSVNGYAQAMATGSNAEGPAAKRRRTGTRFDTTLAADSRAVQNLILALAAGIAPPSKGMAGSAMAAAAEWILRLLGNFADQTVGHGTAPAWLDQDPDALSLFEALGCLLVTIMATSQGVDMLSSPHANELKKKLGKTFDAYVPICAHVSAPLRDRMEVLQKQFALPSTAPKDEDALAGSVSPEIEFESSVIDGPVVNSRAGLFIYINAILAGRPLVNDRLFMNYLNNRYAGDLCVVIEELVTAAFDVLANGRYRQESSRVMFVFRTFLVNKLPPFLAEMVASSMRSIPMEVCITRALGRIDRSVFPSFSEMFSMQGTSDLADVRQEFLFSCALHKLIPESSIERLLGENPMQTVGRQLTKTELVYQIEQMPNRADALLGQIESMDGNASAIVTAVAEVITNLSFRKDTVTLKGLCNALSRRTQVLDVMFLFVRPATLLKPLWSLLDAWKWDEDQAECQTVYEEFGSILLLVLAFQKKYDLPSSQLGISNPDSFVQQLLENGVSSQRLDDLTEKQNKNIGSWITALFVSEGISDEYMSSCSPQEFYLLISTLFSQSISACESGKIPFEAIKGGFDYLLEPFLLPSLVIGLTWLANHIWQSDTDQNIALGILDALIRPSSISGEAYELHQTVLAITSQSVINALRDIRSRNPSKKDKIWPIMSALEPYHSFQRSGETHHSELDSWLASTAGGATGSGIVGSIANTFASFVLWSTNHEISVTPPYYTHRQIITGIRTLGAVRVLRGIIDELKVHSDPGSADIALDIAATFICAPLAESFPADEAPFVPSAPHNTTPGTTAGAPTAQCLTLRDALKLEHDELGKLLTQAAPVLSSRPATSISAPADTADGSDVEAAQDARHRAELIVRLCRRVDALVALPPRLPEVPNLDVAAHIGLGTGVGGNEAEAEAEAADGSNSNGQAAGQNGGLGDMFGGNGGIGMNADGAGDDPGSLDMFGIDLGVNPEMIDMDFEGMF